MYNALPIQAGPNSKRLHEPEDSDATRDRKHRGKKQRCETAQSIPGPVAASFQLTATSLAGLPGLYTYSGLENAHAMTAFGYRPVPERTEASTSSYPTTNLTSQGVEYMPSTNYFPAPAGAEVQKTSSYLTRNLIFQNARQIPVSRHLPAPAGPEVANPLSSTASESSPMPHAESEYDGSAPANEWLNANTYLLSGGYDRNLEGLRRAIFEQARRIADLEKEKQDLSSKLKEGNRQITMAHQELATQKISRILAEANLRYAIADQNAAAQNHASDLEEANERLALAEQKHAREFETAVESIARATRESAGASDEAKKCMIEAKNQAGLAQHKLKSQTGQLKNTERMAGQLKKDLAEQKVETARFKDELEAEKAKNARLMELMARKDIY